ncbi:MAG: bifunctional phosphoribosylaminoimidazolecarboxamide formyltransferase/IMP cyclohydrolase, partial [Planctomycetales bacterium]
AIAAEGRTTLELRRELAAAAFRRTAQYDQAISAYFDAEDATGNSTADAESFPETLRWSFTRRQTLRYGENPHQAGAFYAEPNPSHPCLSTAEQLHGKELSYNNLLDLDAALGIVRRLPVAAAVVIKHNNPCGAAVAETLEAAFREAYAGDPVSAFGSILGFNQTVDAATAEALAEPGRFIEAIIAPDYDAAAFGILTTKPKWKNNVRLLKLGPFGERQTGWDCRRLDGGLLVQRFDCESDPEDDWKVATQAQPTDAQWLDLRFGWEMVRHVKSNAIVLARGQALLGVGAGQMSRVDSVRIALEKSAEKADGSSLASDAFFPFPDSIEVAAQSGVKAVIQPGGSKRDPEVIEACDRLGLAMVFTGRRHFKH